MRPLRTVAGLSGTAALQAVTIIARFNYLTRVADGTGIEADYGGTLPTFRRSPRRTGDDAGGREPGPAALAGIDSAPWQVALRSLGDDVAERYAALQGYVLGRESPLSADVRSRLALVAAEAAGDDAWIAELAGTGPVPVDGPVLDYAEKLAVRPGEMTGDDLESLRALGLDDRTILDVISVVAFAAAHARLRIGLTAVAG